MVKILKLKFGQDFEAEVWLRFCGLRLAKILSQEFGKELQAEVWSRF